MIDGQTRVLAWRVWQIVRQVRPDMVSTTGAAPGYFALHFAKRRGGHSSLKSRFLLVRTVVSTGSRRT
jgi:hypothetical protein